MDPNNMPDKRIHHRMGIKEKCILANRSVSIETQTVDISKMGLGVKTDSTLPFKIGCELAVFIPSMDKFSRAKLVWTKKDSNNITRLGLKLSTCIIG